MKETHNHEGKHLMLTEEVENELRSAFTRAAAGIEDPEPARQRLLQRNYRPGRGHRQLAAGLTATAAAAALVVGLGAAGAFSPAAARGAGTIQTTAFSLVKHANGTATLTINLGVLLQPSTLQSDLQQDGIPALVTSGSFCTSAPAPAGFNQVVPSGKSQGQPPQAPVPPQDQTVTFDPAAIPAGAELSFGYFPDSPGPGGQTAMALIDTNSNTCSSTVPTFTTPPPGADVVLAWHPGNAKTEAAKAAARRALGLPGKAVTHKAVTHK
jgi:hypothetical protein